MSVAFLLLTIRPVSLFAFYGRRLLSTSACCLEIEWGCEQHGRFGWMDGGGPQYFAGKCLTLLVDFYLIVKVGRISVPLTFGRLTAFVLFARLPVPRRFQFQFPEIPFQGLTPHSVASVAAVVPCRIVFLKSQMVAKLGLQRPLQDGFDELFQ